VIKGFFFLKAKVYLTKRLSGSQFGRTDISGKYFRGGNIKMARKSETSLILTVPEEITDHETLYLTGNEYISLPEIDSAGGIRTLNVLRLDQKGLLEFSGGKSSPLLAPRLLLGDQKADLAGSMTWDYHLDWLPSFSAVVGDGLVLEGEITAPPGFKGFCYSLMLHNKSRKTIPVQLGWQGRWEAFNYIVFNRRPLEGRRSITFNKWTESLVLEASAGLPQAAMALAVEPEVSWNHDESGGSFSALHNIELKPGTAFETSLFVAVNLEADGAGTTAIDLRRRGKTELRKQACSWLESRRRVLEDDGLSGTLNRNLFFSYFYSIARSLDSEELVPVTSRSPRYYVSAAFWSRDTLLWSFPAILTLNRDTARELLLTVYSRHIKNAGDHAHYINGTVLYPGFELDQLAAFFIALEHYLKVTGDYELLEEKTVREGLALLTEKAFDHFDPESGLYGTFLDPSDDPVVFPFLTYNNALLQRAFSFLGNLQARETWEHKGDFAVLAGELQQAIYENCMVKGPFGMMFAWAVDGMGRFSLYDNPPGSLQLLAHYGFCSINDIVFINTVHWIRSSNNRHFHQDSNFEEAGSVHAGNPWPLSACNDLLACNAGALDFLSRAEMDNGFFCETVSPVTGKVSTGAAFASAAGFLAYALINKTEKSSCREDAREQETSKLEPE
jgi:uncharacterized protein